MLMKSALLALTALAGSVAQAITVAWAAEAWDDAFLQSADYSCYLVTSATDLSWSSASGSWATDSQTLLGGATLTAARSTQTNNYGDIQDGKMNTWVSFDAPLQVNQYYYLVFVAKKDATDDAYAITGGTQWTSTSTAKATGLLDMTADSLPDGWDYVDVNWMFTNVRGTPEPTALALLALGVAGLALRRRV